MICTDNRLVGVCTELFRILTSDEDVGSIQGKEILVRNSSKTGSFIANITIGLMTIEMIYKPAKMGEGKIVGSDEGANVFILLPFEDDAKNGIRIPAYYSERGKNPELKASPAEAMRSPTFAGVRRVIHDLDNPSYTKTI
jgi:hypothetical protein